MQAFESELIVWHERVEENKRDQTKVTAQVYRELEKQHNSFNMKFNQ